MSSTRAAVFEEILPYINSGDWGQVDQFIVFGKAAFNAYVEEGVGEDPPLGEAVRHLINEATTVQGQRELLSRTSFRSPSPGNMPLAMQRVVEEMTEVGVTVEQLAESIANSKFPSNETSNKQNDTDDMIDAALAERMIQQLKQAQVRATSLHPVPFKLSGNVATLFEEAHMCDLADLKIATAVLSRAVLEDSLKRVIDPTKQIKQNTTNNESYIGKMLDHAREKEILDGDRVRAGKAIRDAGNHAIHDLSRFNREDHSKITKLVDELRKVLEDLHIS